MKKIVIDANVPISFIHSKVKLWGEFKKYVQETNYEIIMPRDVYDEITTKDRDIKRIFRSESDFINVVEVDDSLFNAIKNECKSLDKKQIQDNDFKLICSAIENNADILVSNDYRLIVTLEKYKVKKGFQKNQLKLLRPAGLLRLMHLECKNSFDWKTHIDANLKFYHHIEISNTFLGINKKEWNETIAKSRFMPFRENIVNTIKEVNVL